MSNAHSPTPYDGLVCTLRLLFDGVPEVHIAKAIAEACGQNVSNVWWHLGDHCPIMRVVTLDVQSRVFDWENIAEKRFTGSFDDLISIARALENGPSGVDDYSVWYDDIDSELSKLAEDRIAEDRKDA